jgi:glycosyltransferase involved in cell wall biosynthesis
MSRKAVRSTSRIALLVEACSAGVGRHVIDLGEELIAYGHSVHLIYSTRRMDLAFTSSINRLRRAGATLAVLDMRHNGHISDLAVMLRLRRYLRTYGPFQLLHSHSTKAGLIGRLSALGLSCRTVYTPHAFFSMSPVADRVSHAIVSMMEVALSRLGDGVICVSNEEEAHAIALGVSPDKLFRIPNGINLKATQELQHNRASIRERFGLKRGDLCVGFVGRLFPQKAPGFLLEAFAAALPSLPPEAKLVIVGEGPLKAELKARASELNLATRIVFAGAIPGPLAMAGFDVFALPSCYEGFPYVLIEALALGLPIVSTAVGGATSLVHSGVNGFIVPVGASGEFASSLVRLLTDRGLRQSMAEASRFLAQNFTIERMVSETIAVYRYVSESAVSPYMVVASS